MLIKDGRVAGECRVVVLIYPYFAPLLPWAPEVCFFRSSLRTQAPGENGKNKFDERETGEPCRTRGHREPCLRAIFLSNPTIAASLARYKTRNKVLEQNA